MTQEDKVLLLKDLCARLPYGVKGKSVIIDPDTNEHRLYGIDVFESISVIMIEGGEEEFTPYLFPLSSMTEEQRQELESLMVVITVPAWGKILSPTPEYYDWLNKNHFDYRGLIKKELAIDATGLNIY